MFLSERQARNIQRIARSYGIEGNPAELVADALNAILHGEADEVAYSVTEAVDIVWLVPGICYRKEKVLNAEQARAIIAQAKSTEMYEAPIPEDDAKAVSEAEELVKMAEEAWASYVRGPEVEALLRMAADAAEANGDAPSADAEPEAPAEPEQKFDPLTQKMQPAEPQQPSASEPAESADSQPEIDPALTKVEPWEGYDKDRVGDINEGLKIIAADDPRDEALAALKHVWAYETAHKGRVRVLNTVDALAKELTGQEEDASTEEEPAAAAPGAPAEAPEPHVEAEADRDDAAASGDGGSSDSERDPVGDAGAAADAPADAGAEAPEPGEEDRPGADEAEPPAEDGASADAGSGDESEWPAGGGPEDGYDELIRDVEDRLRRERLTIPEPPGEDLPKVPWDWTQMSTNDLHRIYGAYSVASFYMNYRMHRDERIALLCKQAADELSRELLLATNKYDDHGKEKRVAVLEAEVAADPEVKKWRLRQHRHEAYAANHRNERDGFNKIVESMSRLETMRHNEFERSGGMRKR